MRKTFADLRGGLNTVLDRVQLETQEGPLSTPDCLNVLGRSGGIESRSGTDTYKDLGAAYRLYTVVAIMPWNPIGGGILKPPIGGDVDDPPPIWIDLEPIDPDDSDLPPIYIIITPPPIDPPPPPPASFGKVSPNGNTYCPSVNVQLDWQVQPAALTYTWTVYKNAVSFATGNVSAPTTEVTVALASDTSATYTWGVIANLPAAVTVNADGGALFSFYAAVGSFAQTSPPDGATVNRPVLLQWEAFGCETDGYTVRLYPPAPWSPYDYQVGHGVTSVLATQVSVGGTWNGGITPLPIGAYTWRVAALLAPAGVWPQNQNEPTNAHVMASNVPGHFTVIDNACSNCSGGPGTTPTGFAVSIPNLTLTRDFGEDGHIDHIFNFSGSAVQTSPCLWVGIIGVITVKTYNGAGALVSTTNYDLTATIERTIIGSYHIDIDVAGVTAIFGGNVTTTGCVGAVIALVDEYGFDDFTSLSATITP